VLYTEEHWFPECPMFIVTDSIKAKAEYFNKAIYKFLRVIKDGREVPVESDEEWQNSHVIIELEQLGHHYHYTDLDAATRRHVNTEGLRAALALAEIYGIELDPAVHLYLAER
jgi:hypothetical protein